MPAQKIELGGTRSARHVIRTIRDGNRGRHGKFLLVTPAELREIEQYLRMADAEAQLYRNTAVTLSEKEKVA